jgi:hypothetical protein
MTSAESIHPDMVIRARVKLLTSDKPTLQDRVWAYRILARIETGYLPRLADNLVLWSYQAPTGPHRLTVLDEAVAAARLIDKAEPRRGRLLLQALDARQRCLYTVGRRTEGMAVREEMASLGRPQPLAAALAEEGRHEESAAIHERLAETGTGTPSDRALIASSAELEASGRLAAAITVAETLIRQTRRRLSEAGAPLASLCWELTHLSRLLDVHGETARRREVDREIVRWLQELATTGERRSWSNIQGLWTVLLGVSSRADEPAQPGRPGPAFGEDMLQWSPDVRTAYLDSRVDLTEALADLTRHAEADPDGHLPALVTMDRRLTVREAHYWTNRTHRIAEPLRPAFDRGVALARRLTSSDPSVGTGLLARALTDRSGFHLAARDYAPALDDFREAVDLRG